MCYLVWDTLQCPCPTSLAVPIHLLGLGRCSFLWSNCFPRPGFWACRLPQCGVSCLTSLATPRMALLSDCQYKHLSFLRTKLWTMVSPVSTVACFLQKKVQSMSEWMTGPWTSKASVQMCTNDDWNHMRNNRDAHCIVKHILICQTNNQLFLVPPLREEHTPS